MPALGTRAFDHHLAEIDHRHGRELELDESSYNEGFVAGLRKGKSAAKFRSGQSVGAAAKQGMDRRSKRKSKPSMKQKQLKDSVGKRTAGQPPPNCKVSKHLRFKSDSDDDKDKAQGAAAVLAARGAGLLASGRRCSRRLWRQQGAVRCNLRLVGRCHFPFRAGCYTLP